MAHLVYGLLCDQIRIEAGTNKHILIGVFDRFNVRDFAEPLPPFAVFGRVIFEEYGKPYGLDIGVKPIDGDYLATITGSVTITPSGETETVYAGPNLYLNFSMQGLKIPRPGHYAIVVIVDGDPVGQIEFYARDKTGEDAPTTFSPTVQPPPSSQSPSSSES